MDREYEWDEGKREATIEKHHIDFLDAPELFEANHLDWFSRTDDGEECRAAMG